jgi:signal transduction histidine kinase
MEYNGAQRQVCVSVKRSGEGRVQVVVEDSGIGLSAENLTRIFAHGFTTKRDGHGFGLHSGALAAKQMGGSLRAESEGVGCGARFILELSVAENTAEAQELVPAEASIT